MAVSRRIGGLAGLLISRRARSGVGVCVLDWESTVRAEEARVGGCSIGSEGAGASGDDWGKGLAGITIAVASMGRIGLGAIKLGESREEFGCI